MDIDQSTAIVTGAASGLGEATAIMLAQKGAKVALWDLNFPLAQAVSERINQTVGGSPSLAIQCDITRSESVEEALAQTQKALCNPRILMNIAGVGSAKRVISKEGVAAPLEDFARVIQINLIGTYNVTRLFAAECAKLAALDDQERGVIVMTASAAAFEGQIGQQAYSASKGGLVSMTLPMARDLAQHGIRVCSIAPGLFATPLLKELPPAVQESLAAAIPFPKRLGEPKEFASLACHIVSNRHLNGEVIRLDGALRMASK